MYKLPRQSASKKILKKFTLIFNEMKYNLEYKAHRNSSAQLVYGMVGYGTNKGCRNHE
jgi:hypothetical protein